MPEFMPIMVKTGGAPCLVVGGGKVALRKVLVLLRFGGRVTAVAQHGSKGWQQTDFGGWLQHERGSRTQPDWNRL